MKSKQTHKELSVELRNILSSFENKNEQVTNICTDGGSAFCKAFRIFGNVHDKLVDTTSENVYSDEAIENLEADLSMQSMPYMIEEDGEAFCSNTATFGTESLEEHIYGNNLTDIVNVQEEDIFQENIDSTDDSLADKDNSNEENFTNLPPQRRCLSHLLNLVSADFKKALPSTARSAFIAAMNKLHAVWVYTHRSCEAKAICQEVLGCCLLMPNETR